MKILIKAGGMVVVFLLIIFATAFLTFPREAYNSADSSNNSESSIQQNDENEIYKFNVEDFLKETNFAFGTITDVTSGSSTSIGTTGTSTSIGTSTSGPVISAESDKQNISVLIVPHHLVAVGYIIKSYAFVAENRAQPKRIFLFGPNHFFRGNADIITSARNWTTNYGQINSDKNFIEKMANSNLLVVDDMVVKGDFSITSHLPFIKKFFPDALLVPIIMREPITKKNAEIFGQFLANNLTDDDLIIISSDFSHYQTKEKADEDDEKAVNALLTLDTDFFQNELNGDSRQIYMMLMTYLRYTHNTFFHLLDHTNSATLTANPYEKDTTGHIYGYYSDK